MKSLYYKLLIVTIFSIAMAFLESAVVIYLREIMYPEGFNFPLAPIHPDLALTEILRELATLIMLVSIGLLAAKSFSHRFAWFIFSFAVWDIFYYVFLWILIGWPDSFMTWDVLFLIPATWTGPVITPLILTIIMIFFALVILIASEKGLSTRINRVEWIGLTLGSIVLIIAFITDYMKHMLSEFSLKEILNISDPDIMKLAQNYVPGSFPWLTFLAGTIIIIGVVLTYSNRLKKQQITR